MNLRLELGSGGSGERLRVGVLLEQRGRQAQLQDDAGRAHLDSVASIPERRGAAALDVAVGNELGGSELS